MERIEVGTRSTAALAQCMAMAVAAGVVAWNETPRLRPAANQRDVRQGGTVPAPPTRAGAGACRINGVESCQGLQGKTQTADRSGEGWGHVSARSNRVHHKLNKVRDMLTLPLPDLPALPHVLCKG